MSSFKVFFSFYLFKTFLEDFYRRQAHRALLVASRENPDDVVEHVVHCLTELQSRRKEET